MKWRSIRAILLQDFYITKGSWEVIFDVFVYTLINISLFGFIAQYLSEADNKYQVQTLLIAIIFWEVARINQYSTSVSSMWNVWSHTLCNMFIAPVRVYEYLLAHIISAVCKSTTLFIVAIILGRYAFNVDVLSLGIFPVIFTYLNMVLFGTALGLALLGLVFRFGTRIQALTWSTIYVIQPLCAVFFPVNVLPALLQPLAYSFPATYFFEWLRALQTGTSYSSVKVAGAFVFNLAFLILGCFIFSRQLAAAKRTGQLVRNDL